MCSFDTASRKRDVRCEARKEASPRSMTNDDVSVPGDLGQKLIPEDHTSKKQQKAIATMAAAPPHALEVTPESALQFVLTRDGDASAASDGSSAKCTMTLRHTGQTTESIAFKVRQEASDVLFWGRDVCLFSFAGELGRFVDPSEK